MLVLVTALSGCAAARCCFAVQVGDGEADADYLVFGLGLFSIAKSSAEDAIVATKVRALGVTASDQPGLKLGLGFVSANSVLVPDGAEDVRVEVTDSLLGPFVVDTASATIRQGTRKEKGDEVRSEEK